MHAKLSIFNEKKLTVTSQNPNVEVTLELSLKYLIFFSTAKVTKS